MARLRRTPAFDEDRDRVLRQSGRDFGPIGRRRYASLLRQCLSDLGDDPSRAGVGRVPGRDDLRLYHLKHGRIALAASDRVRRPRHLVFFAVVDDGRVVLLLRLLHERMLAEAWLPPRE